MTNFIVDLPIQSGGSFHSYVNVYQRVSLGGAPPCSIPVFPQKYLHRHLSTGRVFVARVQGIGGLAPVAKRGEAHENPGTFEWGKGDYIRFSMRFGFIWKSTMKYDILH